MAAPKLPIDEIPVEDLPTPDPRTPKEAWQLFSLVRAEQKRHYVPVKAAGIAFFAFIALVPTLAAALSIAGLVVDADEVAEQITEATEDLPEEISGLLSGQMERIAETNPGALGLTIVLSIVLSLWAASGATKHLMSALNTVYEFPETRGFARLRGTAYGLTAGAIVTSLVALFVLGALPSILSSVGLGPAGVILASLGTYPLLFVGMVVALSVLYWIGPDRSGADPQLVGTFQLFNTGAVIATLLWVLASAAFSIFVSNFGNYGATYGALAAVVVLLGYMNLTAGFIVMGAEINATRTKVRLALDAERRRRTDPPPTIVDGKTTQYGKAALAGVAVGAAIAAFGPGRK